MSPRRLQFTLLVALVLVLVLGIAMYVFAAYLPDIFIGAAGLALLLGGITFRRHHQLAKLPLKAHALEAARQAHAQEMERQAQERETQWLAMERERHDYEQRRADEMHTLKLQLMSGHWQLEQHLALTRVLPDAKGHYPYIVSQDGQTYQHLPNPHMSVKQIAASAPEVVEEEEDAKAHLLPSLVRYDDIRSQVPRGHTLLGIGTNGLETRPFQVLSTCWIVGGSKTGKSNTVALKVEEAYKLGCWFCVIDPHRYKDDSLFNSIKGYRDRFIAPGCATAPEDILAMLKAFWREAQARLSGESKKRTPIILLADEIGHICDTVGLEGEELALAQETVALFKKLSRMCGQELRGFNMFGWFISQTAAGLAWLRKNAMTVIAHKVLMMSERKLACNEDMALARSMDTWPIGRIVVYGLDFPDGSMILQQPLFTPRIVNADPVRPMEDLRKRPSSNLNNPALEEKEIDASAMLEDALLAWQNGANSVRKLASELGITYYRANVLYQDMREKHVID